MDAPKISIIVPVYNCVDYLPRGIESILYQDEPDFELILVNDGSTDSSADICKRYVDCDERLVLIDQCNKGVAAARNAGLKRARGKYITFMDGDDWLERNAFSTCLRELMYHKADMVKFGYYIEKIGGKNDICRIRESRIFNSKEGLLEYTDKVEYHAFVWNMFMKKEIVQNLLFDEDINWLEDQIFGYRCFLVCSRIAYLPVALYHYRYWEDGSLSSVKSPKVISLASQREYILKTKLTEGMTYRHFVDDEYRWRLEFMVTTLYSSSFSYALKKELSETTPPLFPLHLREGKLFFNELIPFRCRNFILKLIFFIKKFNDRKKRVTRV